MNVSEVMSTDVKTISPDSNIMEAAKIMADSNIGCLIVSNGDKLDGILTEMDILRRVVAKGKDSKTTKVSSAMSKRVVYIKPDLSIEEAADVMAQEKVKKLPVVQNNNLVGLLTIDDIAKAQPLLLQKISEILIVPGEKKKLAAG